MSNLQLPLNRPKYTHNQAMLTCGACSYLPKIKHNTVSHLVCLTLSLQCWVHT